MATIRRILRQAQLLVPKRNGVTVLAYHLVDGGTQSPVDISGGLFRAHLHELSTHAHVVSLREAVDLLVGRAPVAPRTVVLTFDDAYRNFYTHVFPLLQEHGFPATLYVPTHFVDEKGPPPIAGTDGLPACSWGELRTMQESGLVTIGAHTRSHPSLPDVSPARARWELATGRERLEDEMGTPVPDFCYPRGLWTHALERLVRKTYATATVGGGVLQRPGAFDPVRIQRISIRSDAPRTLRPMLEHATWLEEWLADQVRRRLR